jgi:glycosyltransferase involved in cell wall biosynthesis
MAAETSILLSSFNGAAYLREQLDSLLNQSYQNTRIQVRDDGSSDATPALLRKYAAQIGAIDVFFGQHLGIVSSFFWLLERTPATSEYVAFCDQDDVWYLDKIERAVAHLAQLDPDFPALYCSRLEYVDATLRHIGFSRLPARGLSFAGALAENAATGCTIVMNRAARELITGSLPKSCIMHDWWCYLVVAAFGQLVYDESPGLKYRLHGANDTGAAVSLRDDLTRRARRFWSHRKAAFRIHAQAQEFAARFGERLVADKRCLLEGFLSSKDSLASRVRYALNPGVSRQLSADDLLLRALIMMGWY